ncbi:MAG: lactonase family protein [Eubacteriales bacterium]
MANDIISEFYAASDRADGGAYRITLTSDFVFRTDGKIDIKHPQWIEIDGDRLCAAFRDPENGDGYAEYSVQTGERVSEICPTMGQNVCHFCKSGDDVYFANYDDGVVSKKGGRAVLQSGEFGTMKSRQSGPHAHECIFSPDKRYVLACDLGLDSVIVYDRELNEISRTKVLPGHGVRHALFSPDGKKLWAINELGSTIAEFSWDDGRLEYIRTYDMLDSEAKGDGAEIVLSPDGHHLYATNRSNRGTKDYICHFEVGEVLRLVSRIPSMGNHPRHFTLISGGRYAVCSNTFENSLALFCVKSDGELEYIKSNPLPSPMCVCEI